MPPADTSGQPVPRTDEPKPIRCGWCGEPATREFDYTPHWLVDRTDTLKGHTCAKHDPYPQASKPYPLAATTIMESPMTDVNASPLSRQAYDLCLEIEKLPASEQQTTCSLAASALLRMLAAAPPNGAGTEGLRRIAAERQRQIADEGWTPQHDDTHAEGELARAAAVYAWPQPRPEHIRRDWPWGRQWYKPATPGDLAARLRDLDKAGALIAAEIDRLLRASTLASGNQP